MGLQTAWNYARNGHVLGRVPRALRPPRGDKLRRGREADQPPVPLWIWRLQPERQLHRHAVLLPIQMPEPAGGRLALLRAQHVHLGLLRQLSMHLKLRDDFVKKYVDVNSL